MRLLTRRNLALWSILASVIGLLFWLLCIKNGTGGAAGAAGAVQIPVSSRAETTELDVYTVSGEKVMLDLRERPVLFFAWWCPHCREVLACLGRMPAADRPVLVDVWCRPGDGQYMAKDLAGAGGAGYYVLPQPPPSIQGVPTLLVWAGRTQEISGARGVIQWAQTRP